MRVSLNGIKEIKKSEALRLNAYLDKKKNGVWTIGWGATFYEDGSKVKKGDVINEARAIELLHYHVNLFSAKISPLIKTPINPNQFDALVSFSFNVGAEAFKTSTLLRVINKNPNDPAIRAQFMRWVYDDGEYVEGLALRRGREADLYFKPSL